MKFHSLNQKEKLTPGWRLVSQAWLKSSFQKQLKNLAKNPGKFLETPFEFEQSLLSANIVGISKQYAGWQLLETADIHQKTAWKTQCNHSSKAKQGPVGWSKLEKFCRALEKVFFPENHNWLSSWKAKVVCSLCSWLPSPRTTSTFYLLTQSEGGAAKGN